MSCSERFFLFVVVVVLRTFLHMHPHWNTHDVSFFFFLYGFFMPLFMFKMSNMALDTLQTPLLPPQSPADSVFKVLLCCGNHFITNFAKTQSKISVEYEWSCSTSGQASGSFLPVFLQLHENEMHLPLTLSRIHTNTYTGAGVMLFCPSG